MIFFSFFLFLSFWGGEGGVTQTRVQCNFYILYFLGKVIYLLMPPPILHPIHPPPFILPYLLLLPPHLPSPPKSQPSIPVPIPLPTLPSPLPVPFISFFIYLIRHKPKTPRLNPPFTPHFSCKTRMIKFTIVFDRSCAQRFVLAITFLLAVFN